MVNEKREERGCRGRRRGQGGKKRREIKDGEGNREGEGEQEKGREVRELF